MTTRAATVGIVLAGGIGKRFRSRRPKIVHELLGRPLVGWPVAALRAAGAEAVRIVVSPGVRAELAGLLPEVELRVQDEPLGTGDAARVGVEGLSAETRVWIVGGDTPCLRAETLRAMAARLAEAPEGIVVLTALVPDPHGYGRIVRDEAGDLARIVEERDASESVRRIREINAGVYATTAGFLARFLPRLRAENAQGELYLVDVVAAAVAEGLPVRTVTTEDPDEIQGVNDRAQLAAAAAILRDRIVRRWQAEGVTFLEPTATWIEPEVELARDVEIGPGVELRGRTRVAEGVRIERGCVVRDTEIGTEAHLRPYVVTDRAVIGPRAVVGPFAHLRPETRLGEEVRVGNFVEIKKSSLGPRSKANHLAYLGDATIGADVNVGAGTITCNYDGVRKHPTIIEDGAFIGSDTQLVAPVRVGAGAIVGAGTTVTRDVSPGALAISRVPQKEIPDYARRRRAKDS